MSYSKRLLVITTASFMFCANNAQSDVASDLENFWERAGGGINATSPQVYNGQKAGFATFGSLYVRTKQRNASLLNVQLPSVNAGCGGIDIFGGSFSFINKDELVQLGRGIMQNAAGFAFELALKSMSPAVQDVVAELRALIEKVNAMNINSCETAQGLVSSLWPKIDSASQHICKAIGTKRGLFSDYAAGRHGCGVGNKQTSTLNNSGDDFADQVPVDVNYAWKAVNKHLGLISDKDLAQFFMTLTGTIITVAAASDSEGPKHSTKPPRVGSPEMLKVLIEGGTTKGLKCDNLEKCLNPTYQNITIPASKAFYPIIEDLMLELAASIDVDDTPSDAVLQLIQMSPQPVYRNLLTAKAYKYQFVDDDIAIMSQYVAISVAMQYLSEALEEMSAAAGNTDSFGDIGREFQDNIRKTQNNFNALRSQAFKAYEEATRQFTRLQQAESHLAAKGSAKLAEAMRRN